MTRLAACAAAVLALLAGGCGGEDGASPSTSTTVPVFDTQEAESRLIATQKRATPDLDVRDATCPARVPVTEGASFDCTVVVEGVVVPYRITVTNVEGERFGYDIRPAKAILLIPKLVEAFQRNSPGIRVDCGPERVRVLDVGSTFSCSVTDRAGTQTVNLRVEDELGNVTQVP